MASDFVGRGVELARLEAVCSRAKREGRPAAALITGLPGAGKTRLLAELRSRQQGQQDVTALSIVGYETGTQVPLAAAGELLHALVKVPGVGARLEAALFGASPAEDRPLEPLRIFEAAHRSLLGLPGMTLLFIDDLQWVDELSIALCSYLVRSADGEGKAVALIAASRPAGAGSAFYDSMTADLGSDRAATMVLGPLERDQAVRLARQLAPHLAAERATELWSLAQGSPFWLGVLARSADERDLTDYLVARERRLSRDSRRLLGVLAVAGRPLPLPEVDAIVAWHETRTEQAVAELERSGLGVVEGISVRLAHDLIRSWAEAQLPSASRRELHVHIAGWLDKQANGDLQLLLEALVHRREAGLDVGDLALRILQSPRRRLLGREGLKDLSQVADAGGFSGPLAAALHDRVALLASELGEHRVAMERWIQLAANVTDPSLVAKCYLGASRAASRIVERREEALPLLNRARSQKTADPAITVEIGAHRASLLRLLAHRTNDARQAAEQAVRDARTLWAHRDPSEISAREREAYTLALQAVFDAAVMEEDTSEMLRISEEMAQVARGSEEPAISAALNMSTTLWDLGQMGEAVDHARRAWLHSHEQMLPMLTLAAGSVLAPELIDGGRWSEAEEVTSECAELERRIGGAVERLAMAKVATHSIHELRHLIWFSRGDWRDAASSVEREVGLQPDPHYRLHLHWALVVWLARCGRGTRSVDFDRHAAAARDDAVAAGCPRCARETALKLAEGLARLGRVDDAQKTLATWDEYGRPANVRDQLWRRHVGALIGLAKHEVSTSISELETVVADRMRLGLMAGLLWARLDLAAALLGREPSRAANEFRQAGNEASTAGATTEQRLAELGLRRLGVRTWRRGRASSAEAGLDKLSERERQIAILVAAGNTNPEIADRLFLSRKTIERHVSNVLARTGARNRTDLARLVSRLTSPSGSVPGGVPGRG